jgi:hypothetical protein
MFPTASHFFGLIFVSMTKIILLEGSPTALLENIRLVLKCLAMTNAKAYKIAVLTIAVKSF